MRLCVAHWAPAQVAAYSGRCIPRVRTHGVVSGPGVKKRASGLPKSVQYNRCDRCYQEKVFSPRGSIALGMFITRYLLSV